MYIQKIFLNFQKNSRKFWKKIWKNRIKEREFGHLNVVKMILQNVGYKQHYNM